MSGILRGALAGVVATVPMSAVMLAGDRFVGRQPPEAIVRGVLEATPGEVPEAAVGPLVLAAHLGFGAALGAVSALLPGRGPAKGVTLALAVYAASYQGWVPALGVLPRATRDRPGRPAVMVVAHVVHGVVLGALEDRLARGGRVGGRGRASSRLS